MGHPSIAELEAATVTGALEAWLQRVRDEAVRSRLRRALEVDRRLWTQYPDSLASCLLARTLGDPGLGELHARWARELDERATPWIAALRPLPVPDGLLAELHDDEELSFKGFSQLSFASDDVVRLVPGLHNLPPEVERRCLTWSWTRGEVMIVPLLQHDRPAAAGEFPKVEGKGWNGACLIRSPGAAPIPLPCPKDSSAHAAFTADHTRVIVYGSLDEYSGGFVYLVDPATLGIERSLDTRTPVWNVYQGAHHDVLLVSTSSGPIVWRDGRAYELHLGLPALAPAAMSPSGAHVATFHEGLRVWSLDALIRRSSAHPASGFPACFDPSGDRLLCDRQIFDGRTGQLLAELKPVFGQYLEGGPPQPWLYFGTRHLICMHSGLQIWDTRSGQQLGRPQDPDGLEDPDELEDPDDQENPDELEDPVNLEDPDEGCSYPHWYSLAYDREATRLAALHHDQAMVVLRALPSQRRLRELAFEIEGTAIAMSADGQAIAIQGGGAVEVRTAGGQLLLRRDHAVAGARVSKYGNDTLRFSGDGQRIARFVEGDGWRIWSLVGDRTDHVIAREALDEVADFAPPRPHDWTLQASTKTVFTHRPSGTRIALPVAGPWAYNPADPRIVACDAAHLELRAR